MQLSPEERHKIYEEEKARIDAEQKQWMTTGGSRNHQLEQYKETSRIDPADPVESHNEYRLCSYLSQPSSL